MTWTFRLGCYLVNLKYRKWTWFGYSAFLIDLIISFLNKCQLPTSTRRKTLFKSILTIQYARTTSVLFSIDNCPPFQSISIFEVSGRKRISGTYIGKPLVEYILIMERRLVYQPVLKNNIKKLLKEGLPEKYWLNSYLKYKAANFGNKAILTLPNQQIHWRQNGWI